MADPDRCEPSPKANGAVDPDDPARRHAIQAIGTVRRLLDENLMALLFDEPIDRALEAFDCPESPENRRGAFLKPVADFVQHVFEHGLRGHRRLSESQALDEAVALLEQLYQGADANGYDAAAVDAADPQHPGVPAVLAALAEALKNRERQAYVRWVVARYIDAADWDTRCAMAAVLVESMADYLPPEVLRCLSEQLANLVFKLLSTDITTDRQLQSALLWARRRT